MDNISQKINKQLTEIANEFINTKIKIYEASDIVNQIQSDLQNEIRKLYSEIKDNIRFNTELSILDSIADFSAHTQHSSITSSILKQYPKYYRYTSELAMECTLSSAILKLALEEKGQSETHTVLLSGHQVAISEDVVGGITLYDPATRWTGNDQITHGFMHKFDPIQIINRNNLNDLQGKNRGFKFRIETQSRPPNTGMFSAFDEQKEVYYHDFFASEQDTLIELSVVLHNLDELSDRNDYTSLENFDAKKVIKEARIFDHEQIFK